jgi:hypothetical protein
MYFATSFVQGGDATGPPAMLDYVVLYKTDHMSCSHGRVANSVRWKQVSSIAGRKRQMFCLCKYLGGSLIKDLLSSYFLVNHQLPHVIGSSGRAGVLFLVFTTPSSAKE